MSFLRACHELGPHKCTLAKGLGSLFMIHREISDLITVQTNVQQELDIHDVRQFLFELKCKHFSVICRRGHYSKVVREMQVLQSVPSENGASVLAAKNKLFFKDLHSYLGVINAWLRWCASTVFLQKMCLYCPLFFSGKMSPNGTTRQINKFQAFTKTAQW